MRDANTTLEPLNIPGCKHEWRACEWGYDNHQNGEGVAWKFATKVFCTHCLTKKEL